MAQRLLPVLLAVVFLQHPLMSQAVKDDKKTVPGMGGKEVVVTKPEPDEFDPFRDRKGPGIGLLMGVNIPMGELGKVLGMGYGGMVTAGMTLPVRLGRSINLAGRLHAGYYSLPGSGNDFTGTVSMLPFTASLELYFFTEGGARPYFSLGGGVSYLTLSGDSGKTKLPNASSLDGTMIFNCGIGYTVKNMPSVEFLLNYSFLMAFENVIGQFSMVSLGVQYRYGAGRQGDMKTAPATRDKADAGRKDGKPAGIK